MHIDYSASELGIDSNFNFMTALIQFFAAIGWAYDLKRPPKHVIDKRKQRTGESTEAKTSLRGHPIIDWTLGLTLSASLIWMLFGLRLTNYYLSALS